MAITLNWLIHQSKLENLSLAACPELIDTPISSVNIMDNPDVIQWFKKNELVLTTGYVFADDPKLQTTILQNLKEAGCSALGIKTKRYFDTIPQHILDVANRIHLPIIELPVHYSFSDISGLVNKEIYAEEFRDIAREQTLYNALFNSFFEHRPTADTLELLSRYLDHPVLLLDDGGRVRWHTAGNGGKAMPLAEIRIDLPRQQDASSHQSVEVKLGDTLHLGAITRFGQQFFCILTDRPDELPWDTIDHALRIIALSQRGHEERPLDLNNYYEPLFQFLIDGKGKTDTEIVQLCDYYAFPYRLNRVCVLIAPREKEKGFDSMESVKFVRRVLKKCGVRDSFIASSRWLVCLYLFGRDDELSALVRTFVQQLLSESRNGFIVGTGPSGRDLKEIASAYEKASFMLSLGNKFPGRLDFFFQEHFIFWQIHTLPARERERIYRDTVKPLADHDAKTRSNLMQTLQVYFDCRFNASLAASRLYLHRNTFLKRIAKIKDILPMDLEDSSALYAIHYGLCIHRLLM